MRELRVYYPALPKVLSNSRGAATRWITKKERDGFKEFLKGLELPDEPTDVYLDCIINFFLPTKRNRDIQNLIADTKPMLDAMQGFVYYDDKQIMTLTAGKEYRKGEPGVLFVFHSRASLHEVLH